MTTAAVALSLAGVPLGWVMFHTAAAFHYAHRFYSERDDSGHQPLLVSAAPVGLDSSAPDEGPRFAKNTATSTPSNTPTVITTADALATISGYGYVGATNTYLEATRNALRAASAAPPVVMARA